MTVSKSSLATTLFTCQNKVGHVLNAVKIDFLRPCLTVCTH
ncbi:hypothetical protein CIPAW_07G176300 [Carya illinoinensis]|uniref:Uncharacterized protein n=1 Tax=Carya illinoinensis TaxID=32201 RepID=A0A8T1Q670_CARIL|nr:hypothetical protein CIPAW_07G176300 [Carya illinoinensis]